MRIPRAPTYQVIGFWLSMPFIAFALCYIMYGERLFSEYRIWLIGYPIIYGFGYISFLTHFLYDSWLIRKYPSLDQTRQRVLYKIPVNVIVMTPSVLIILYTFHQAQVLGYSITTEDIWQGYLTGLSVNIIFESLWEVIYIIDKVKETVAEKERIEQLHLQQEFDNLKQKVNPHFLFNSFNTLSSLITEDKNQAEAFLDELSKVYRYLLRNNESGMNTVRQETQFIQSYASLLRTRHGEAFQLTMDIEPEARDKMIPSLSLQLLVENAVKHNVVSKHDPVRVNIFTSPDGYLTVENNLNKKNRIVSESTGIGLANIRHKYRLLHREDVMVNELADRFVVKIPML